MFGDLPVIADPYAPDALVAKPVLAVAPSTVVVPGTTPPATPTTATSPAVVAVPLPQTRALQYSLVGAFLGAAIGAGILAARGHKLRGGADAAAIVAPIMGVAAGQWLALRKG